MGHQLRPTWKKLLIIGLNIYTLIQFTRANFDDDELPHPTAKIIDREIKGETEITIPVRGFTIWAPYVDTDLQNRWFDFGGSTIIDTNRHVRLTQDRPSQAGYLWSRYQITQSSFQITVEFKIDGKSTNVYGDGMAFWLSKNPQMMGPVFGSTDLWEGLGIFIDTFANSRHPYAFPRIMAMSNYGYKEYDVGKDGEGQEEGACSYSVRAADVSTMMRISYVRGQFLEVLIQYNKWDEWHHCFTLWNHTLPEAPFLGFTAHTGEVSDAHDIISVQTHGLVYHPPALEKTGPKPAWQDGHGGGIGSTHLGFLGKSFAIFLWIFKWVGILGCIGLALFWGKKNLSKFQSNSMKQF